ncbi:unnamed protein product [Adineta steineri]|uniref:Uncharacterized protein n=2 Tax=Adineta steineri TaxID=433720 RepID=A0A814ZC17_9BILA|nr:unnamed protein product [Adineta steineri]
MVVKKFTNGDKYDGEWKNNMKNGEGTLVYADGGQYAGSWVDDERNGHGVNKWSDGRVYTGDWQDNKQHGDGTMTYTDGGKYVGEWENDMRNGHGVNIWSNGDEYDGSWVDNERQGQGTFIYNSKGNKYVGEWSENMRHGYGTNTWANGDRYEGMWANNEKHGKGTLTHSNGSKEDGIWTKNKLNNAPSKDVQAATKKFNSKDALQFKGLWLNGQPFIICLMPRVAGCSYQALAREYLSSLNWDKEFFDHANDRCYCSRCYKETWKDVIDAGNSQYVIPRGWVRLGLQLDPVIMKTKDIFNKWIVTFHGTTKIAAQSILQHRKSIPGLIFSQ